MKNLQDIKKHLLLDLIPFWFGMADVEYGGYYYGLKTKDGYTGTWYYDKDCKNVIHTNPSEFTKTEYANGTVKADVSKIYVKWSAVSFTVNYDANSGLKNKSGWDVSTPDLVMPNSNIKVGWICEKGHKYEATIGNRTVNDRGCPFCSGSRLLRGYNDFETWCKNNAREDLLNELNSIETNCLLISFDIKEITFCCP